MAWLSVLIIAWVLEQSGEGSEPPWYEPSVQFGKTEISKGNTPQAFLGIPSLPRSPQGAQCKTSEQRAE